MEMTSYPLTARSCPLPPPGVMYGSRLLWYVTKKDSAEPCPGLGSAPLGQACWDHHIPKTLRELFRSFASTTEICGHVDESVRERGEDRGREEEGIT